MPSNLNRYSLLVFLIVATAPRLALAQTNACSKAAIERAAVDVADGRKTLLALPLGEIGAGAGIVPPGGPDEITRMKDRLNTLVVAYMVCLPVQQTPDPERIQQDLSRLAHAFKLPPGRIKNEDLPKDFGKYGFELWFDVRATKDSRRLVGITASFSVQCAGDALLLIFSPGEATWQEVLRWQSKPYKQVGEALSSFQYGISPPGETASWYVVAFFVSGWCSSTWSAINYSVLRPVPDAPRPKVIFAKSDSIWWGNEDFGKLIVDRQYFDLRFHAQSIDAGVHNRVFVRRYAVNGDVVHRILPVAVSPRDFVDEWIVSSWEEAKSWSAPADLQELKAMHEKLSNLQSDPKSALEYVAVKRCTNSPRAFQVSVCPDDVTFYLRVETHPSLTMISVKETPDPDCAGRNLLDDMATK